MRTPRTKATGFEVHKGANSHGTKETMAHFARFALYVSKIFDTFVHRQRPRTGCACRHAVLHFSGIAHKVHPKTSHHPYISTAPNLHSFPTR